MNQIKVRKIGNSLGVILPREVLKNLRVGDGDTLTISETSEGYRLSPYDSAVAKQVEVAKKIMRRYRNTLRELAK